jgi:hypothetical protein
MDCRKVFSLTEAYPMAATVELLDRKVSAPVYKIENTAAGIRHADHVAPSIRKKVGDHLVDKRRSLGRYSSLADSDHGVSVSYPMAVPVQPVGPSRMR